MIAYLKGEVTGIEENSVFLEVMGVGYEVFMAYENGLQPVTIGQKVKIYIHENIKEDCHDLYGFLNNIQKVLFKKLIGVSGIGPKSALQVFNLYTVDELIEIIVSQDTKAMGKVSGIGPKTAGRIILELKDVVEKMVVPDLDALTTGLKPQAGEEKEEAIEALIALGFQRGDVQKALKAIYTPGTSVEELIKKALTLLM